MLWDGDTAGKRTFADSLHISCLRSRINDSPRRWQPPPTKERRRQDDIALFFSFRCYYVHLSPGACRHRSSALPHSVDFHRQTRQVTQWWTEEEALGSANERPLPPTEAYCTVHSSCRRHEDGVEHAGDPPAKLYQPALSIEQRVTGRRDALNLCSHSCVYCKVGFQVFTHVIIFHDCFVLSLSLLYL